MPLFGSHKPAEPQTPRVTEQTLTAMELLHDGALRTIHEITGPIGVGDIVTITPKDPTNWGATDLSSTVRAIGVCTIDYGNDQHFSFLTLELDGTPNWVTLEGEGKNREWRAYVMRFLEDDELIGQLKWCLGTYLADEVNDTRDFLLTLPNAKPFDDGTQKVWTAYSARNGLHVGLLGGADYFPSDAHHQHAEYQDCSFSMGQPDESPLIIRFIAIGEYNRALIGEAVTVQDVQVLRTS
jgi:hypothetical protein